MILLISPEGASITYIWMTHRVFAGLVSGVLVLPNTGTQLAILHTYIERFPYSEVDLYSTLCGWDCRQSPLIQGALYRVVLMVFLCKLVRCGQFGVSRLKVCGTSVPIVPMG